MYILQLGEINLLTINKFYFKIEYEYFTKNYSVKQPLNYFLPIYSKFNYNTFIPILSVLICNDGNSFAVNKINYCIIK